MAKKNSAQLRLFEQASYEYFVLLSPSDIIKEDVDQMKQHLDSQIGLEPHNLNSIAHVSLFKTEATEDSTVLKFVKKIAASQQPFTIQLSGFEILKHGNVSRTICLKIEDPEPVNNLVKSLDPPAETGKKYTQTSILDKPKRPKQVIHPHVPIARKIPLQEFTRISDFSVFDYQQQWLCDSITVLKRPSGNTGHFSPCKVIPLG